LTETNDLSLLSALSLFTLAGFLHVSTCEHTAVMGLQELSCLVKSVHVLLLLLLFASDDLGQVLSPTLLLDTLSPLLPNLGQLLLVVVQVSLLLIAFFVFLAHFSVIGLQGLSVLLVCAVVGRQELLFFGRVLSLHLEQFSVEIFDGSLEIDHCLFMVLLLGILQSLSSDDQVVQKLELFLIEVLSAFLEVLDFDSGLLFGFFALLDVFVQILLLVLQLIVQLFHALGRRLHLLLHTVVFFKRGRQLGVPKRLSLLELCCKSLNLIGLRSVDGIAELTSQLGLHVVAAESVDQFQDVALDGLRISDCFVLLELRVKQITV